MGIGLIILFTEIFFHLVYTTSVRAMPNTEEGKRKAARIPGLVHAIHATASSIYVIYNHFPRPILTSVSTICIEIGPTKYVFAISLGYFFWDLFICFKEKWGIDWKIHAIFCVAMYGLAVCYHTFQRWGIFVLFYEFSTVFLHCYTFLYWFGYKWIAGKFKILFAVSFFFCRIVVGTFVTKECLETFLGIKETDYSCIGHNILAFVIVVNILFHCLNFYWFFLIVKAAICGKSRRKKE